MGVEKPMGTSSSMRRKLARQASLALTAGMLSIVPAAHGMPTLDNVEHGDHVNVKVGSEASVALSSYEGKSLAGNNNAAVAAISSGSRNNVLNWKDFSIAKTETVGFDDKNYMNIVTGKATSAIDGKLTGGGNIYLLNPNGVIFGATARVNVGNLYVSARTADAAVKAAFLGDQTVTADVGDVLAAVTAGDAMTSDVVNLVDTSGIRRYLPEKLQVEQKNLP